MVLSANISKYKKYLKGKPGVYIIKNIYNGKIYIGSTGDLFYRLKSHRNSIIKNNHSNKHLLSAINKYGIDCFEFNVLMFTTSDNLMKYEQYFIDLYKPQYNIQPFAYLNRGYKHTKEAIEKIRLSGIGRKTNNRTIIQLDMNGDILNEWSSIDEAGRKLNINSKNICTVCKYYSGDGKIKRPSAGGYIWKYA